MPVNFFLIFHILFVFRIMNGSFIRKIRHLISRRGQAHFEIGTETDAGKQKTIPGPFFVEGVCIFFCMYEQRAPSSPCVNSGALSRCGAVRRDAGMLCMCEREKKQIPRRCQCVHAMYVCILLENKRSSDALFFYNMLLCLLLFGIE